jgi:hypothetical protein
MLLIPLHLFFQNLPIIWAILTGKRKKGKNKMETTKNDKIISSATIRGPYLLNKTAFDPF